MYIKYDLINLCNIYDECMKNRQILNLFVCSEKTRFQEYQDIQRHVKLQYSFWIEVAVYKEYDDYRFI